jgi:hypothetical protein
MDLAARLFAPIEMCAAEYIPCPTSNRDRRILACSSSIELISLPVSDATSPVASMYRPCIGLDIVPLVGDIPSKWVHKIRRANPGERSELFFERPL